MTQPLDVYDSEIDQIIKVQEQIMAKCGMARNYPSFENEIRQRFAEIGFTVQVVWRTYSVNGVPQEGALPDVTITGRTEEKFEFDPDRQVHEVTQNLLEIPGQEKGEVIRADQGEAFKNFRKDHGHGHSHSHHH